MMLSSIEAAIAGERPIGIDLLDFRSRARTFWETLKSRVSQGSGPDINDQGAFFFYTTC